MITLGVIHAHVLEYGQGLCIFDKPRRNFQSERVAHVGHGRDQRLVTRTLVKTLHKTAVDLDGVERDITQMTERGVASAEVV